MGKRHSSRHSSPSAGSPMMDYEDESAAELSKPSKRLKTADGSAVASPSSTTARELGDEEMQLDDHAAAKKDIKIRRKSRSSNRPDDVEVEAEAVAVAEAEAGFDDDAANATVLHHNGNSIDAHDAQDANTVHDTAAPARGGGGSTTTTNNNNNNAQDRNSIDAMSDISEDTDGEVPIPKRASPTSTYHHLAEEEINNNEPQVTVCAWDSCNTGDLGTMDKLVEHLHAEHVEGKQRRYTCEWIGCPRKGKSHASAYALKAHLRSHTREKPHICLLPECDQAFARQDALNKHMRTAHEIDLMRSFDSASRIAAAAAAGKAGNSGGGASANGSTINGSSAAGSNGAVAAATNGKAAGSSKLKIIIKTPLSHAAGHDDSIDQGDENGFPFGTEATTLSTELGFSARELDMPPKKLYGLCRSQLRWAEEEAEELRKDCAIWEEVYNKAWLEQQVLLDQVIQSEKDWYERRKAVLASLAIEEEKRAAELAARRAEDKAAAAARGEVIKDEDDSAGEDDGDGDGEGEVDEDNDDDDDDDGPSVALDPDATQDDYSFADATSFSVVGSSLRNEVAVNGD